MMTTTSPRTAEAARRQISDYLATKMPEGSRNAGLLWCSRLALEADQPAVWLHDLLNELSAARGDSMPIEYTEVERAYTRAADGEVDSEGGRMGAVATTARSFGTALGSLFSVGAGAAYNLDGWLKAMFSEDDLVHIGAAREARSTTATRSVSQWCADITSGETVEGPYICTNPLKQATAGRNDANIAVRKHLLLEIDCRTATTPRPASEIILDATDPRHEQLVLIQRLIAQGMPVCSVVYSGNKGFHAWVRIEQDGSPKISSPLLRSMKASMTTLGFDTATTDASRLSRLPFVKRDGIMQSLVYCDPNCGAIGIERVCDILDAVAGSPTTAGGMSGEQALVPETAPLPAPRVLMDATTLKACLDSLAITPWYDEVACETRIDGLQYLGLPATASPVRIANAIEEAFRRVYQQNMVTPTGRVLELLDCLAEDDSRNAYESLFAETWDGVDRLDQLVGWLRPEGHPDGYARAVVGAWLAQTAMISRNAGNHHTSFILVLNGPQGCGKTTWCRQLVPQDTGWYGAGTIDVGDKDTCLKNRGKLIVELAELGRVTSRRDHNEIKYHIEQATDEIRRPYARAAERRPRRTSFVATSNDSAFLTDTTGNRRWLILDVLGAHGRGVAHIKAMCQWMEANRMQVWAQADYEWCNTHGCGLVNVPPEITAIAAERAATAVHRLPYELELAETFDYDSPRETWRRMSVTDVSRLIYRTETGSVSVRQLSEALQATCNRIEAPYQVRANRSWYLVPPLRARGAVNATPATASTAMQSSWPTDSKTNR